MGKNNNIYQKLLTIYFIAIVAFWAFLLISDRKSGTLNYWYSFLFGLIPLFGGLVGMFKAKLWGGLKSSLGKAIFFISLGLFLWGFGESIWSYYNFFRHVPAPYPSVADIGFAPSIFFWILGTAFLAVATGALFALKKTHWAKVFVVLVPLILLVPSYYIQVTLARSGTLIPPDETALKTVLDIAYPFGDFLALGFASIIFILSYRFFGGIYRRAIVCLLAGLIVMYCADSIFSYTTTEGTYYNGDWGDLLLAFGLYLMTFGILAFATKPTLNAKSSEGSPEGSPEGSKV
jgi:hypothetical protein